MKSAERELEVLATFVHGSLAALHVLGVVFNARRGNRGEAAVHLAAAAFDVWAMQRHSRRSHA